MVRSGYPHRLRKMRVSCFMEQEEKKHITIEIPPDFEYFAAKQDSIWSLLKRYHHIMLVDKAEVKSDPVYLSSKRTGNSFCKFTVKLESPMPWHKKRELPIEQRGDVFIDCFAFESKKNSPGGFILDNIRKGALISGIAILRSGKKPVKHENDEYRANWVYGDYVYINIKDIKVDREAREKRTPNPYSGQSAFSPFYQDYSRYEEVSDDDIRFDI